MGETRWEGYETGGRQDGRYKMGERDMMGGRRDRCETGRGERDWDERKKNERGLEVRKGGKTKVNERKRGECGERWVGGTDETVRELKCGLCQRITG